MISNLFLYNNLLFLDISAGEILLIILVIFLVFGPNKIPEIARMLGKGFNEVRNASSQIRSEINSEVNNFKEDLNVDLDMDDKKTDKKETKKPSG
jgi:TatA/E family protein of Tat protein translocase